LFLKEKKYVYFVRMFWEIWQVVCIVSKLFFLEHAGELRIIVLIEEKESYIDPNPTHPPTTT